MIQQTLEEFLNKPFGKTTGTSLQYRERYIKYRNANKIKLVGVSLVDDIYYSHLLVPSENNDHVNYDVVIQFTPADYKCKKQNSLENYIVKFFSNCPSFIYKYAALYKRENMLIEDLCEKLGVNWSDKMPDKTNPNYILDYDKSLYYAGTYILEHKLSCMSKASIFIKRQSHSKFIESIQDFDGVIDDVALSKLDKSIRKEENTKQMKNFDRIGKLNARNNSKIISNGKKASITKKKPKPKIKAKKKTSGLK